jgi:hypothetical protein
MAQMKVSYRGHTFYIPDDVTEQKGPDAVGMQHWFHHSLRSTLTYAEQLWHINNIGMHKLHKPSVLEAFCGFGMSTAPFRQLIGDHWGIDHDWGCAQAFSHANPEASIMIGDTYKIAPEIVKSERIDYALLEYNSMTMYRLLRSDKEMQLLQTVIDRRVPYIVIVDSARVKEHLHRKTYGDWFGKDMSSYDHYVAGIADYFKEKYGYAMIGCAHDAINYTYLFELGGNIGYTIFDARAAVDLSKFEREVLDVDVQP